MKNSNIVKAQIKNSFSAFFMRKTIFFLYIGIFLFSCSEEVTNTPGIKKEFNPALKVNFDPNSKSYHLPATELRQCHWELDKNDETPSRLIISNGEYSLRLLLEWTKAKQLKTVEALELKKGKKLLKNNVPIADIPLYIPELEGCLENIFGNGFTKKLLGKRWCPSILGENIKYDTLQGQKMVAWFKNLKPGFEKINPLPNLANKTPVHEELFDYPLIKHDISFSDVDYIYDKKYFENKVREQGLDRSYLGADYANKLNNIPRVTGFAFTGRSISPEQMKKDNGMCTRDDQVDIIQYTWLTAVGGWVSATRSPNIAKWYAQRYSKVGWVYIFLIEAGFDDMPIQEKGKLEPRLLKVRSEADREKDATEIWPHIPKHKVLFQPQNLQEVSERSGRSWKDVMAYRKMEKGKFEGPIFIRIGFREASPQAFEKIRCYLSGGTLEECQH